MFDWKEIVGGVLIIGACLIFLMFIISDIIKDKKRKDGIK